MTDTERPLLQRLRLRIDTPRTRQWAAWLLGLWLGFALLAFFVLPPLAKSMLSQQLGQMLQREVSIASVSVNPFNLNAQLQGLSVKDRTGAEQFGFEQLSLNLSSLSIAQAGIVVDALRLQAPRVSLARLDDGRYDISDLLDAWLAPSEKPSSLPRFSVNNVEVVDGRLDFDDRPKGVRHTAESVQLSLPFISSMAYKADVFVQPRFSAVVDGSQLAIEGQSQPFAPSHTSELKLQLQGLQLARLQPYVPASVPVRLQAGQLSTELQLGFSADAGGVYTARLSGTAQVTGLDLTDTAKVPFLKLDKAALVLQESDPLHGRYALGPVSLEGLSAGQPLRLDKLQVDQAQVHLPARRVEVTSVQARALQAQLQRNPQGQLQWMNLPQATPIPATTVPATTVPAPTSSAAAPSRQGPTQPQWAVKVDKLTLEEAALRLEDRSLSPVAVQTLEPVHLSAENLDFTPGAAASPTAFVLSGVVNQSGTLKARGTLQWQPLALQATLDTQALPMASVQAYLAPYLNVALVQGQLANTGELNVRLQGDALQARYQGSLTLSRFLAVDKVNNADFLRWKTLYLGAVDFELAPRRLNMGEIALTDFYSRLILSKDGRLNLADMVHNPASNPASKPAKPGSPGVPGEPQTASEASTAPSMPIQIGKVTLQNGQVNFSDYFVRPNYSANITRLGGSVQNLSSKADTVATLDLRGSYASNAPVHIAAKLNPLADKEYLDLQAEVSSIDLVDFSPYAGKYAGYAIDKGKLSLNATYKLQDRQLSAENRLFIDQLTFGEKVESPDATQLPVQLAVALLKNNRGEIDINLPIAGSLDDPQFSISGLIFRMIGNLFVKAVTSPFALLGSMFGGGEELSSLSFAPGRASLDEAALKKLEVLAKAMREREGLKLAITAKADPQADEEGLKRVALERAVQLEKRKALASQGRNGTHADSPVSEAEYNTYLSRAYGQAKFPKPRNLIGLAKELPAAEMEKLMLANQSVTEEDLHALATARAQATQAWLVETGQVPLGRIFLLPVQTGAPTGQADDSKRSSVDFSLR